MRRVATVLVAALGVAVSVSLALAQGPGGPPPDGPPGGREDGRFGRRGPPSPLWNALDANHDGELSAEEIENAPASLRKLDKNKDGKLSFSELMPQGMGGPGPMDRRGPADSRRNGGNSRTARDRDAGAPGARGDAPPPGGPPGGPEDARSGRRGPPSPLWNALDTNHDGELSAEEIDSAPASLRKLDKNKDGKLSFNELMPQGMGGPGPMDRRGQAGSRRLAGDSRGPRDRDDMPPADWDDPSPPGGRDAPAVRNRDARPPRDGEFSRMPTMFDKSPVAKDDAEKQLLATLAAMSRQRTPGGANVPTGDGRILRVLAESIGAKNVVEIGTSTGYSTVWLCVALRQTGGKVTTFEIDAERAAQARDNFAKAGVAKLVTLIEGDAHEKVSQLKEPIDLLFIDADKEGYLDYVKKLLPLVRPGGLIVSHNMNERQADPEFVKAITGSPKLETVFLNMERSGLGVTLKKR